MRRALPHLILLSAHDPSDVRAWSGTIHFAHAALEQLDPGIPYVGAHCINAIERMAARVARKLGFRLEMTDSRLVSRLASLECSIRLAFTRGDVIVAVAAKTHCYALRTSRPIVFVSDATYAAIEKLYQGYATLPAWLRREASDVERAALARSAQVAYASEWAKLSAMKDYDVPAERISVLPFGPNIERRCIDRFKTRKTADFSPAVRILFVAADWNRKGGDLVLDIKRHLDENGIPCELLLVGGCRPGLQSGGGIHVLGRLDKNRPDQLQRLCALYESAHFFVMPTTGEAFGVVFSEAQAFGCPSLTYAVGGTTTAVRDGETGFTLPLGAPAAEFARIIASLVRDPERYEAMSATCRTRFEQEASWEVWAREIMRLAQSQTPESSVQAAGERA